MVLGETKLTQISVACKSFIFILIMRIKATIVIILFLVIQWDSTTKYENTDSFLLIFKWWEATDYSTDITVVESWEITDPHAEDKQTIESLKWSKESWNEKNGSWLDRIKSRKRYTRGW